MTPPTLTTERLTLRAPRLADFGPYAAFFASERSRYENGPKSRGDAWKEFASATGLWMLKGYGALSIEDRATEAYLGEIGIFHPANYPEPELGWMVVPEAEGRGVAREAALALRAWAYASLGLESVVSYVDADNTRSIRLAERLGAVRDPDAAHPEDDPCLVFRHPGPEHAA